MALVNFTMPFGGTVPAQPWTTISPLQRHATAINNMLYSPVGHQQDTDHPDYDYGYKNDPYAPPTSRNQQQPQHTHQQQQQQHLQPQPKYQQHRQTNDYLPPPTSHRQHQPTAKKTDRSNDGRAEPPVFVPTYTGHTIRSSFGSGDGGASPPKSHPHNQILQQQPLQPPLKQPQYNNYNGNGLRVTNYPVPISTVEQPILAPPGVNRHHSGGGHEHDILSSPNRGHTTDTMNSGLGEDEEEEQQQEEVEEQQQQPNDEGGRLSLLGGANGFPSQAPTFTRVQAGTGSKTQVHAILDYDDDDDDDEYYDDENDGKGGTHKMPTVTPIQGPIFLKNGSVPVVPLFSYPTMRNGSFVQIPIWWTALSVALGLEIRGEVIRGTPCVKRFNQLFCPTAGNSYPISRIEEFIDENKALMRRMYGDFEMSTQYGPPPATGKRKRATSEFASHLPPPGVPDFVGPPGSDMDEIPSPVVTGDSYFSNWRRTKRQSNTNFGRSNQRANNNSTRQQQNAGTGPTPPNEPVTGRVDACESKIEIVTPYWASNSAGKIRAIVNTQHFEQAIHQEVCTKTQTGRCGGDCGCEQKYKWHRLLAYDPDNDCRGIFMDWFLFPSCCVCRCNP